MSRPTFTYQTPYGKYENCEFHAGRYKNGNIEIWIEQRLSDGLFCDVTCCVPEKLGEGEIAVKNWSENSSLNNWLKIFGWVEREDPVRRIQSGLVEVPVQRMTKKLRDALSEDLRSL